MVFLYTPDFVDNSNQLIQCIDSFKPIKVNTRNVLQFGEKKFIYPMTNTKFPKLLQDLANSIDENINHCIINIYPPFTNIPKHVDDDCLGNIIYVVSLNSATILVLNDTEYVIDKNSLYTLTDKERYSIHSTLPNNENVRYSITFRILV